MSLSSAIHCSSSIIYLGILFISVNLTVSEEQDLWKDQKSSRTEMVFNELVNYTWYTGNFLNYVDSQNFCSQKGLGLPPARELRFFYKTLTPEKNSSIPILFYLKDRLETTTDHPDKNQGERLCLIVKKEVNKDLQLAEQEAIKSCDTKANLIVCRLRLSTRTFPVLTTTVENTPKNMNSYLDGICLQAPYVYTLTALALAVIFLLALVLIIFVLKFCRLQTKLTKAGSNILAPGGKSNVYLLNDNDNPRNEERTSAPELVCNPLGQLVSFSRQGSTAIRDSKRFRLQDQQPGSSKILLQELKSLTAAEGSGKQGSGRNNRSSNFL